jgi:3-oxoacyl-[acyl-carrier protein] reductase
VTAPSPRRRALVTGGSAGMGYAAAEALAAAGCHVAIAARSPNRLAEAADRLRSVAAPGARIETLVWDLEDREVTARTVGILVEAGDGPPDILVHVAGGPPLFVPGEEDEETFRRFLESHSFSLWAAMRAFAPAMQARGFGRIISVTSRAMGEPRADNPLSAAIRLPAWAMMKSYARSGRFPAVTFNAVLPGLFDTNRFADVTESLARSEGRTRDAVEARFLSAVPAGRLGRPAELGSLCAWLASDLGGYVNGQRIVIDGGSSAGL